MGEIPRGYFYTQGGVCNGLPKGILPGADLVHPPLQTPRVLQEGGQTCQVDPSDHVPTPDAQG